ncbi:MAG TPA: hypothetical protein VG168_03910 [Bryobacteraceae bacterium]|nr:hypothetical protein [Bryobacteraceae bacterium]
MHRLIGSILFLSLVTFTADGQDSQGSSTVTVGGGWAVDSDLRLSGGPHFSGTYEYRTLKYMALDAGVGTTVSSIPRSRNYYGTYSRSETGYFGFRGILPLSHGRVELFGGPSGAYLEELSALRRDGDTVRVWRTRRGG